MIDIEQLKALVADLGHIEFSEDRPNPRCAKCVLPDLLALLEEARELARHYAHLKTYGMTPGNTPMETDWGETARAFLAKLDPKREG